MAQTIKIKRSSTSGNKLTSSNSVAGELGLNTADKALYIQTGSSNGDVVTVAHESTLKIDESNSRIGIGTTSPTHQLHVAGAGDIVIEDTAGGSSHLRLKSSASGSTTSHWKLKTNAANHFYIDNDQQGTSPFSILSGGNVGIGTSSPGRKLTVQGGAGDNLPVRIIGGSGTSHGSIEFQDPNTTADYKVTAGSKGDDFYIQAGGGEKVRILANGRVGIGTSSPAEVLHVAGNIRVNNNQEFRTTDTGGTVRTIMRVDSSDRLQYGWSGNGAVAFMGGGSYTERMRIHTNGNIGIGTTTPGSKLTVEGDIRQTTGDLLYQGGGNWDIKHLADNQNILFYTSQSGSATEKMRIRADGNVGIGTSSPSTTLHVDSVSDFPAITIARSTTASGLSFTLGMSDFGGGGTDLLFDGVGASTGFGFRPRNSSGVQKNGLIIAPSGNVGIGVTTPDKMFVVQGPGAEVVISDTDTTDTPILRFRETGTTSGVIKTDASHMIFSAGGTPERMRINSSGYVGIGTTAPTARLHISGNSDVSDEDCMLIIDDVDGSVGSRIPAIMFRSNTGGTVTNQARIRGTDTHGIVMSGSSALGTDLVVRADGVGIGTHSPSELLHVVGTNGAIAIDASGASNTASLKFINDNERSRITSNYGSGGGGQLGFWTDTTGGTLVQRMAITNAGNVGINTTSPYSGTNVTSLTVNATSYPALSLQIGGNNAGLLTSNSSGTDLYSFGNKRLQFITNDTTRIRIAGTGGVTFNEEYTFPTEDGSANQVLKTDGSGNLSFVTIAGAGAITEIEDADGDTKIQVEESADEDIIRFDAAGSEIVRMGFNSSTESTLEVVRNGVPAASGKITFNGSGLITDATSGYHGLIVRTGGTERLRVKDTGDVGIGTTSPYNKLQVAGNARIEGNLMAGGASATNVPARPIHVKSAGDAAAIRIEDTTSSNLVFDFRVTYGEGLRFINVTGGITPLFISSGGDIGIGNTNADRPLTITSDSGANAIALRARPNDDYSFIQFFNNAGNAVRGQIYNHNGNIGFTTGTDTSAGNDLYIKDGVGVGIGTSSPTSRLEVHGSVGAIPDTTNSSLQLRDTTAAAANVGGSIIFSGIYNTSGSFLGSGPYIKAYKLNATSGDYSFGLKFATRQNGVSAQAVGLTITPDQKIGIGITTPTSKVDIRGTHGATHSRGQLYLSNTESHAINQGSQISLGGTYSGTNDTYFGSIAARKENATSGDYAGYLQFGTRPSGASNVERMRITSAGNVGIGTTSPSQKLQVTGTILADTALAASSGNDAIGIGSESTITDTSSTYRIKLVSDSNSAKLTTYSYGSYLTLKAGVDGTNYANNWSKIELRDGGGVGANNAHMKFYTHGDERMIIDNGGNVGIGTASPGSILDVVAGTSDSAPAILRLRSGTEANTGIGDVYAGIEMGVVGAENSTGALTNGVTVAIKAIDTRSGETSFEDAGLGFYTTDSADSAPVLRAVVTDDGGLHVTDDGNIDTVSAGQIKADGNIYGNQLYSGGTRIADSSGQIRAGVINATDVDFIVTDTSDATTNIIWRDHSDSKLYLGTSAAQVEFRSDITVGSGLQAFFDGGAAAANPAITFGTDTDTGIIRPSTNALGFVTGGVERVRISSSGNLSITGNLEGPATFTIDPAAVGDNTGTVVIAGNLQVDGTTTTINSTTLTVDDKNITLASGSTNAAAANGAGITVDCGSDTDATLTYVSATDDWKFDKPTRVSGLSNAGIAFTSTETLVDGSSALPNGRIFYHSSRLIYDSPSSGHRFAVAGNQGTNLALEIYSNRDIGFYNSSGAADLFWDASTSRLGIGTTSPAFAFHAYHATTNVVSRFESGDSQVWIDLHDSNSGTYGALLGHDGANDQLFMVADQGVNRRFIIDNAGQVGIGNNINPAARLQVEELGIDTTTTTTSATTPAVIDTMAAATFRSAEFTIQVTNSTDSTYHLTKVLLIHDGTTPGITEYGTVFTGSAAEATFDADISSGNVRLLATPASTDSMTFKVVRHCITV